MNKENAMLNQASPSRRELLERAGIALAGVAISSRHTVAAEPAPKVFRLWASSDCHVGTDLKRGRASLADAIRQSEQDGTNGAPGFDWDVAIHAGDFSGNQGSPKDDEGQEVVRQFSALKKHRREQFYCVAGNHDATLANESTQ